MPDSAVQMVNPVDPDRDRGLCIWWFDDDREGRLPGAFAAEKHD